MIADLKSDFNIRGISKKETVTDWLKKMQDYEIVITEDSPNIEKELRNYQWHDKKAGVPIDAFNHFLDEIRYCFMDVVMARRGMRRTN
jgi:phage terminase large subunit